MSVSADNIKVLVGKMEQVVQMTMLVFSLLEALGSNGPMQKRSKTTLHSHVHYM